ncbi:MAG: hypothetical protein WA865_22765, partial [Spirulinaceae cyanobacterium]
IEKREGDFEVYNFDVEGFSTYFVSDLGVLVHNACSPNNLRGPLASRHKFDKVRQKTPKKNKNSVVEPSKWPEIQSDIAAINKGQATRKGNIFETNNRKYELFQDHLVPIHGPGVHNLDRGEFGVLGLLNAIGDTPKTRDIAKSMGVPDKNFDRVLQLWKKLK